MTDSRHQRGYRYRLRRAIAWASLWSVAPSSDWPVWRRERIARHCAASWARLAAFVPAYTLADLTEPHCQECSTPIDAERLRQLPRARFCGNCA